MPSGDVEGINDQNNTFLNTSFSSFIMWKATTEISCVLCMLANIF